MAGLSGVRSRTQVSAGSRSWDFLTFKGLIGLGLCLADFLVV